MLQILLILQVLIALSMIALVLVQHGKGADMGATFGAGSSNTLFGSTGTTPFLVKVTALLAFLFFANSLGINYLTAKQKKSNTHQASVLLAKPKQAKPADVGFDPTKTK